MWIDKFKRWARLAPPATGPIPDGVISTAIGLGPTESLVLLALDSRGRVFQINGATISNGTWRPIHNGRSAVQLLMREFQTEDGPAPPSEG